MQSKLSFERVHDSKNRCSENVGKYCLGEISLKSQKFRQNYFALPLHNTVCSSAAIRHCIVLASLHMI